MVIIIWNLYLFENSLTVKYQLVELCDVGSSPISRESFQGFKVNAFSGNNLMYFHINNFADDLATLSALLEKDVSYPC